MALFTSGGKMEKKEGAYIVVICQILTEMILTKEKL